MKCRNLITKYIQFEGQYAIYNINYGTNEITNINSISNNINFLIEQLLNR